MGTAGTVGTAGRVTSDRYDVAVVGAGIVGLSTAMQLLERRPGLSVAVLEKEPAIGRHQTGHNSGVIHAGVYYAPGSAKARLCRAGKARLEAFADAEGIPYERCGKLVVAASDAEIPRLQALAERSRANGITDLVELGPGEWSDVEPHVVGRRALWVRETGIIDFGAVAAAYARRVEAAGGRIVTGCAVTGATRRTDGWALATSAGAVQAGFLVGCAGLHADRLAAATGAEPDVRIVPFRGDYYTLTAQAAGLVRALVYPVPDPALPFLGVHFTRRIDGAVWAGPNAVLALAREGYRRRDVSVREVARLAAYPGLWRLARRYWRVGAAEVWRDAVTRAYVRALRRYVPELRARDLAFGPSGVRAQAMDRTGALVDDFRIAHAEGAVHVLNAPSPAATSSLAIGAEIVDAVEGRLP